MKNQFDQFAQILKRNIQCSEKPTLEWTSRLKEALKRQGVALLINPLWKDSASYIYWSKHDGLLAALNPECVDTVCVEFVCPLMSYSRFYYVAWEDFIALAEGRYVFKPAEEYMLLCKQQDKPHEKSLEERFPWPPAENVNLGSYM